MLEGVRGLATKMTVPATQPVSVCDHLLLSGFVFLPLVMSEEMLVMKIGWSVSV